MNEANAYYAVLSRLHNSGEAGGGMGSHCTSAPADIAVYRQACSHSSTKALAGIVAALVLSGCPHEGGGGPDVGVINAAMSTRNIEARNAQIAQQQAQQQAMEATRIQRREAALEAVRQRQIASDRLVLQQEQQKARQTAQQTQQAQQQGNQGRMLGRTGQQPGQAGR